MEIKRSYLQVKTFNDENECNEFMKENGARVENVSTFYNPVLGYIEYTVSYLVAYE